METIIQKSLEQKISNKENISPNLNIKFLILCNKNGQSIIDCNTTLCFGKTIKDWVKNCTNNYKCLEITFDKNDNIISLIKEYLEDEQITVVLYNDTPLIRQSTILELIENFISKNLKILKLKRGYIFDTEYIKKENAFTPVYDDTPLEDFFAVTNSFSLNKVMTIFKERIMNYHLSNGVIIYDINSTFIDADCEIKSGVVIYPNNVILGKTIIYQNCILYPFNTIDNCIIYENSNLSYSHIKNTIIQPNSIIE